MSNHNPLATEITAAGLDGVIKWRWIEYFETFYLENPVCDFCLGFWISLVLTVLSGMFINYSIGFILIPFACASLSYLIYKQLIG